MLQVADYSLSKKKYYIYYNHYFRVHDMLGGMVVKINTPIAH